MPSITSFRPTSNLGTLYGGMIVVTTFSLGLILIFRGLTLEAGLSQMWPFLGGSLFLALGALYTYWTWGSSSLTYIVDRNALSIRWGNVRQVIPLANIQRLIPGSDDLDPPGIEGVNWPGHHIGSANIESLGPVLFYSAHRTMSGVLFVKTPADTYAISVPNAAEFAQLVQENQERGALFDQRQAVHRDGVAAQSFWLDGQARLLALVLVGAFFVVLGYVLDTYAGLDQSVELRFPALGGIGRIADKSDLLDIPRSAAAFVGLNLVLAVVLHRWERMVSYVLLLSGVAVQIVLLLAAIVAVA